MNRVARVGLICVSVAIFCYAGIGHLLGRTPDDKDYKSLTVFGEVLQKIQQDYVDEPNMRTVTAGSLHGLLESLDTQSSYLTPREFDEYKKKTQNSGTGESGITLSKRFGYIIVVSVLPDSAGAKSGIHSGDTLIVDRSIKAVNGKIIVVILNGELLVRRLQTHIKGVTLVAENKKYGNIQVDEFSGYAAWGVVIYSIHQTP